MKWLTYTYYPGLTNSERCLVTWGLKTFFSFIVVLIGLQEFGDSARARKLYEQDSDDDDDEELEINPKLEAGELHYVPKET